MPVGGSDPFVERVREANDIAAVVGEYVALRKAGARLSGLCPFHREKTPSFYVNPAMQAFHCFGCGVGGDVFTFLIQHEKMTFPEAVRHLAARAGIPVPDKRGPGSDRLERIRETLRVARTWFRSQLEGPEGQTGRDYLDGRGILPATREQYGLGFAPDRWDGLLRHARAVASEQALIEAGLAVASESGRVYDRFRHRLMIPIETAGAAPLGFGGRALGDTEPKYLNSPETAVYRKGSVLYGTGPAREGTRAEGRVVVVEGYFDVIGLVQGGVPGVVGTCGTALTPEQALQLKRLSDRVVLLFDGDAAGLRAALRALPVLVGPVPEVRVVLPPAGKDPDLWIRADGADAVRAALDRARPPLAFLEDLVTSGVLSRRDAAGRAADLVALVLDPILRDLWVQEATGRFGVRAEAFLQAVRVRLARPAGTGGTGAAPGADGQRGSEGGASRGSDAEVARGGGGGRQPGADPGGTGADGMGPGSPGSSNDARVVTGALERECLRTALRRPEWAGALAAAIGEAGAFAPRLGTLLGWIAETVAASGAASPGAILACTIQAHPDAADLTAFGMETGGVPTEPDVLLRKIRVRGVIRRNEELQPLIRRAQEEGNRESLDLLLGERQELAAERARLETMVPARGNLPGGVPGGSPGDAPGDAPRNRSGGASRGGPGGGAAPTAPDPGDG
jgi:DNA primase